MRLLRLASFIIVAVAMAHGATAQEKERKYPAVNLAIDYVVDAKGVKHDWRKDITEALAKRQQPDGSFANSTQNWMEADPNLVTGYALMALSYCKPK